MSTTSRAIQEFTIAVPEATLADLRERLGRTRWPDEIEGAGWEYGTDLGYLKELVGYWRDGFDWRVQEAALNRFPQVMVEVGGTSIHAIHVRGNGPNPMPLLLLHGWPDSFWRMTRILPLLTDPAAHGGDAADAFDVVVPSIPGFGFSERPTVAEFDGGWVTERLVGLMGALGYGQYGVHGGDIGSGLAEGLARSRADEIVGLHLTDVPYWHRFRRPGDLSAAEERFFAEGERWGRESGAYDHLQSTRPQSAAVGLNDSPAGLAAWMVEHFRAWSDCDGEVERRFAKDELLTNLTIYWVTGTIGSSFRMYYANAHAAPPQDPVPSAVPAGFAIFPKEMVAIPRAWAERFFAVRRWREMPRGGHFAAWEEPGLLADELRAFFAGLR